MRHMTAVLSPPARNVVLKGISWETYRRLLAEHEAQSGTHFTYDSGVLEIMVLSSRHEEPNRTLALLVEVLAEELVIDIRRLGSTTFRREDLAKGFEPDSCFYIQHVATVAARIGIDLTIDPPPDLVFELLVTVAPWRSARRPRVRHGDPRCRRPR
jgi:Uma2 family endonuclease